MNSRGLVIAGVVAVVLSLVAVQVSALPQYYGWRPASMMGNGGGYVNQGNGCGMMNGQGTMGNMMNGQQTNYQGCQRHIGPNGVQNSNGQYHQQRCQQYVGPNQTMTAQQCQAMYQSCHS